MCSTVKWKKFPNNKPQSHQSYTEKEKLLKIAVSSSTWFIYASFFKIELCLFWAAHISSWLALLLKLYKKHKKIIIFDKLWYYNWKFKNKKKKMNAASAMVEE